MQNESYMLGILISIYPIIIPFVSYCFQLYKVDCIFGIITLILIGFSLSKIKLQTSSLIVPNIKLILLDHNT